MQMHNECPAGVIECPGYRLFCWPTYGGFSVISLHEQLAAPPWHRRYASYVLDGSGQPLLRLRAGAVHTANLLRSPHCSLFVQVCLPFLRTCCHPRNQPLAVAHPQH